MAGEKGGDIPMLMKQFGCDYDAARDAVDAGNKDAALTMLDAAIEVLPNGLTEHETNKSTRVRQLGQCEQYRTPMMPPDHPRPVRLMA